MSDLQNYTTKELIGELLQRSNGNFKVIIPSFPSNYYVSVPGDGIDIKGAFDHTKKNAPMIFIIDENIKGGR